jgi:GLPGLI family protein
MKKHIVLFAFALLSSAVSLAQMKAGHISYDIEVSSDNPDMEMAVMMFTGSTLDLFFADGKARTDMDMGTMMSMTTIMDEKSGDVLMLMGGMMGDKAVKTTKEEMEAGADTEETPEFDIELTKETKTIAGYTCTKAIVTDESGTKVEYWYTEEIGVRSTDTKSVQNQLPGQPLEYAVDNNGLLMTFSASKVETSLSKADKKTKFSMEIPEGYEEMTYEEFTSGGGM